MVEAWTLTDHACRFCHGRVLRLFNGPAGGVPQFRCAQCGAQASGGVEAACACGVTVGKRKVLECLRIPGPREDGMPEVGARMRDVQAKSEVRMPRFVGGD